MPKETRITHLSSGWTEVFPSISKAAEFLGIRSRAIKIAYNKKIDLDVKDGKYRVEKIADSAKTSPDTPGQI